MTDKGGAPPTFTEPKEILDLWNEYKQSVDISPDIIEHPTPKGEIVELRIRRPYLRKGFEAFVYNKLAKHIHQYIDNDGDNYKEFLGVVTHIRNEWEEDQVSGSLTGRYKSPNLVARLNGISDKKELEHKGDNLAPTIIVKGG